MKAIVITTGNRDMLIGRYNIDNKDEQLPLGYILIADFGNDDTFEVVTPALFTQTFTKVTDIENGFFSISRK